MTDKRKRDEFPDAWFNPDFKSEIRYHHPDTGEIIAEAKAKAFEEQAAAAQAREAHPERVAAFLDQRRATILADREEAGGTLWHMVLTNSQDWLPSELADAGVTPTEEAAARFYDGFGDGTPGLDFSGTGAGFMEWARTVLPDMPREAPGRIARKAYATRALQSPNTEAGHYLAGYLARTEFEERISQMPGTVNHAWRSIIEAEDGDLASAALAQPAVISETLRRFVGDAFERGALEGLSVPRGDDAALRRVVNRLRESTGLPRDVRVELAAADGALAGGKSDPSKLFSTFVRAGEAMRPLNRHPATQEDPEGSLPYVAGYATGQAMARVAVRGREIVAANEGMSIH